MHLFDTEKSFRITESYVKSAGRKKRILESQNKSLSEKGKRTLRKRIKSLQSVTESLMTIERFVNECHYWIDDDIVLDLVKFTRSHKTNSLVEAVFKEKSFKLILQEGLWEKMKTKIGDVKNKALQTLSQFVDSAKDIGVKVRDGLTLWIERIGKTILGLKETFVGMAKKNFNAFMGDVHHKQVDVNAGLQELQTVGSYWKQPANSVNAIKSIVNYLYTQTVKNPEDTSDTKPPTEQEIDSQINATGTKEAVPSTQAENMTYNIMKSFVEQYSIEEARHVNVMEEFVKAAKVILNEEGETPGTEQESIGSEISEGVGKIMHTIKSVIHKMTLGLTKIAEAVEKFAANKLINVYNWIAKIAKAPGISQTFSIMLFTWLVSATIELVGGKMHMTPTTPFETLIKWALHFVGLGEIEHSFEMLIYTITIALVILDVVEMINLYREQNKKTQPEQAKQAQTAPATTPATA